MVIVNNEEIFRIENVIRFALENNKQFGKLNSYVLKQYSET